jgi:hypothetical protein
MQAEANFWEEWGNIGKELIEYGKQVQYGNSLLEVKFMAGNPAVIIRSKSIKKKYPSNKDAEIAIAKELRDSEEAAFDGARTLTIAYHQGNITQVLLDQYSNALIHSK